MNRPFRLLALFPLLSLGLGGIAASAQPAERGGGLELTARYSHAAAADLDGAGAGAEVGVDSYQLGLRSSAALAERTRLLYGLEWTRHELDLAGVTWLPENLKSLAASLGVSHAFDDRWRLLAVVTPRLAGAQGDLGSAGFDVPVFALASYGASPELTWSFGLRYGARSDLKVMPVAGVAWKFAPEWELTVAWPETGVSWRATPQLTLRAVAGFQGGDYRLDGDPRPVADRSGASLDGAWLEYREVRLGVAAEYALGGGFGLRADAGRAVSQSFKYVGRGLKLSGDGALFGSLGLTGRF